MPPCRAELKLSGINFVKHMHFYIWVPYATSVPSFYHWFLLGKSDQFSFDDLCFSGRKHSTSGPAPRAGSGKAQASGTGILNPGCEGHRDEY